MKTTTDSHHRLTTSSPSKAKKASKGRRPAFDALEPLEARALLSAAPTITQQPISKVFGTEGASVTLTAKASGDPAPSVQWEVSVDGVTAFTPITGNASATTNSLVLPDLALGQTFNEYEAVFTNSQGSASTSITTLYVDPVTPASTSGVASESGGSVSPPTTITPTPIAATPAPTATLSASALRRSGPAYTFTVTYASTSAINTSTLDVHDLYVTGPNDYEQDARVVSMSSTNGGKSVAVTYSIKSTGSAWTASNNGVYHVYARANQVKDSTGASVAAGVLGPFKVLIA